MSNNLQFECKTSITHYYNSFGGVIDVNILKAFFLSTQPNCANYFGIINQIMSKLIKLKSVVRNQRNVETVLTTRYSARNGIKTTTTKTKA